MRRAGARSQVDPVPDPIMDAEALPSGRLLIARQHGIACLRRTQQTESRRYETAREVADGKKTALIACHPVGSRVHGTSGCPRRLAADAARALRTPREVRNALVYILQNWAKHLRGARGIDLRSSAVSFDGWAIPIGFMKETSTVVAPRTWLAAIGWRRLGLIHPDERPAPARGRARQ